MTTDSEKITASLREIIEAMEKTSTSMSMVSSPVRASTTAIRKAEMESTGSGDGMKEFLSKKGRLFPPSASHRAAGTRPAFSTRDLTDTSPEGDLEEWLAEQLYDWETLSQAAMLDGLAGLLEKEIGSAKDALSTVGGADLRAEGYHEGQVNALETMLDMVSRAAKARRGKIGAGL